MAKPFALLSPAEFDLLNPEEKRAYLNDAMAELQRNEERRTARQQLQPQLDAKD